MSSIDTRVVEAKFDNRQFEAGVKQTMTSVSNLNKSLSSTDGARGLDTLASSAGRVTQGLNVMRVAAYTAIATIAHQATIAGEQFVRSFTVGPLLDGLHEYNTQLGSIQTILSNTQWEHKSLKDVNSALAELNHYSDKTIYNFGEMARNIGTFTAAGVHLDTSVAAIKGIANLAAVSGSTSQQASTAMYQLSQALSTGTVKLMDWNSVVNAGMGGKVFQDALKETARVHGVEIDKIIKKNGSFRDSLQEGWLSSKILTETLKKFTGDMSREQLKQMGYTEKQIDGIIKLGKTATDAATKVKTGSQLLGTLQETAGSGWAKTWSIVIGNFNEAKDLWTGINDTVGGWISNMAKARNAVLGDWKALGGRDALIQGIKNAFESLLSVLKPIGEAFREIFPAKTGAQLAEMTRSFRDFFENFKIGAETAENLKRTFAGVFAALDIGWQVIKAGIKFIADLVGEITKGQGSGGLLGFTANLGDFLVALDDAIKHGEGLTKFFSGLSRVLAVPIHLVKALFGALLSIFNLDAPSADGIKNSLDPIGKVGEIIHTVFSKVHDILEKVFDFLGPVGDKVLEFAKSFGTIIKNALDGLNYDDVLHTINTGLLAGLLVAFKTFVSHITSNVGVLSRTPGQLIGAITSPFHALTATLGEMQKTLRSAQLVMIAVAIGILTASLIGLAGIDPEKLASALGAMATMFGELFASLLLFERIGGPTGLVQTGAGLILLATALRILTSSVKALAELSWVELAKGLVGVTVLLGGLAGVTQLMSTQTGGMIRAGAGLMLLAVAIRILVSSVTELSGLSWGEMVKGLVGVAAILTALTLYSKFAGANGAGVLAGAGLVLLATAIKILASAVSDFADIAWGGLAKGLVSITAILAVFAVFSKGVGNPLSLLASGAALIMIAEAMRILAKAIASFATMSLGQISKGLVAMAGALALIVLALKNMSSALPGAAALLVVAVALKVLAPVLQTFAEMSWGQIAKAAVVLFAALALIAAATKVMEGALPGAAALLVVAAAFRILAPVLLAFGQMSWTEIVKGLVMLAGALTVIGVAALVLTPVIPSIIGLGIGVALLGAGMLAAGAGILLFSTGLTALAASAGITVTAIIGIVMGLVKLAPMIAQAMGEAIVAFAKAIASAAPAVANAIAKVLEALLSVIDKEAPHIIKTLATLLVNLVEEVSKAVPKIAAAALRMILGVLHAVEENAPKIVKTIAQTMINILNAIADKVPDMVKAGVRIIVAFINGVADNIGDVIDAGKNLIIKFIEGIGKASLEIVDAAAQTLLKFLFGLADAIRLYEPQLFQAGWEIAKAIVEGFWDGLKGGLGGLFGKVANLFGGITDTANMVFETHSPSKVFMRLGRYVAEGFINGLVGSKADILNSLRTFKDALHQTVHDLHDEMVTYRSDLRSLKQDHKDLETSLRNDNEAIDDAVKHLKELQNAKKLDHDAIEQAKRDLRDAKEARDEDTKSLKKNEDQQKETNKELERSTREHEAAKNASEEFDRQMDSQKQKLKDLGKAYDDNTEQLNAANDALRDAISLRDSYNQQIVDQYSTLPDITDETTVGDFTDDLTNQVADTQAFIDDLNYLREQLGLSDEMYKELLAKGPEILPFVEQLVAGGQASVDELNALSAQLVSEAETLGQLSSASLYQAGVDMANGIVEGLQTQRKAIKDEMEHIAHIIARAIRHALKIKSPSQVMHEIGQHVVNGLVEGMKSMESDIDDNGNRLVAKMNGYIQKLRDLLSDADATSPVITPVIDLSSVEKDAAKIGQIVSKSVSVDTSLSAANKASVGYQSNMLAAATALDKAHSSPSTTEVNLTQINNSPKALSEATIYRQTTNQLSKVKGALTDASKRS